MRETYRTLLCVLLLSGAPLASAQEGREILFGDDEEAVIGYLKTHRIPHASVPGMTGGPPVGDPAFRPELDRALLLFKGGSAELRLAIAKSLWAYSEPRISEFWRACRHDDYEAKLHLVGLALRVAKKEEMSSLREWILRETHPSHAAALLHHLDRYHLYEGLSAEDQDAFIPLLRQLYRQPGRVVRFKAGPHEDSRDIIGSVQEYTVKLIPHTLKGRDLLLQRMVSDSKKVDEKTLRAIWAQWGRMARETDLLDDEFITRAAGRMEIAESWLLSPPIRVFDGFRASGHMEAFKRTVNEQILNPDERVRKAAIGLALRAFAPKEGWALLRRVRAGAVLRQRAVTEVEERYSDVRGSMAKTESGRSRLPEVDARRRALVEALR